jgi:copper transport protein
VRISFLGALLLLLTALAGPAAHAHVHLRSSSPAHGDTLQASPQEVRLEFSGGVVVQYTNARLLGPDGETIATPDLEVVPESRRREFVLPVEHRLPRGEYTVEWRTTAADGHVMQGSFAFFLDVKEEDEPPVPADERGQPDEPISHAATLEAGGPVSSAVRFMHYLALLSLLGGLAFHYGVIGRMRRDPRVAERVGHAGQRNVSLITAATALLAVVVVARLWAQSAQLHGFERAWNRDNIGVMLSHTIWGQAWLLQVAGFVVLLVGLLLVRRNARSAAGWVVAGAGVLALTIVPALSGHAVSVQDLTAVAVTMHMLHVLGAGIWIGTLAVLLLVGIPVAVRAGQGERMPSLAATVSLFSPVALSGVALAGVTGIVNSFFHLGSVSDLWGTDYGIALLVKLGALFVALALGFYHWRMVLPGLADQSAPNRFKRTAGAELAFGLLVLVATAVFVGLPRPAM